MKVEVKATDAVTLVAEADTPKDVFIQLATMQEAFGEEKCGKCGKQHLRFVVRKVEDNEFFELHCSDCRARLSYGVSKEGGSVYPKRMKTTAKGKAERDENGKAIYLPNNGWYKWNPETKENE